MKTISICAATYAVLVDSLQTRITDYEADGQAASAVFDSEEAEKCYTTAAALRFALADLTGEPIVGGAR